MSGARILVVDDDPLVAQDIRLKLEALDYIITGTCASGEQALAMAELRRPDLVLMDVVLEGAMTGIEAANLIQERHSIPVVYLTAHADNRLIELAKITDPFGYLLKPPVARELHAVITLALYRAEATRKLQLAAWTSAALMSICDAIIIFDLQGLITNLNTAARTLFHSPRDLFIGRPLDARILLKGHGSDATLNELIARAIAKRETILCEQDAEIILDDGQVIPIHYSICPVTDSTDRVLGAVLLIHVDTQRRNTERALLVSRQQLDAIMEHTTTAIYVKDSDGNYLMVNNQYEKIIGLRRNDILGKTDYDLFSADIADKLRVNDQHVLQGNSPLTFEERIVEQDGPRDYISAKVPLYNAQGKSYAICGISTDITHQRRQQVGHERLNARIQFLTDRLARSTIDEMAFYQDICNGIRELVDSDIGALPYLDNTGNQFTYLAAAGNHAEMLQGKSMPVEGGGLCGWVAQHGETLNIEDISCDSRVIPELASALGINTALVVPLNRNQRVLGGLSAFRNGNPFDAFDQELLTLYSQSVGIALDNLHLRMSLEQRVNERTAQLLASNDELKAFSYSVSHDLRAPLRRIVGFSHMLLEDYTGRLDDQGKDYLHRVSGSAERMNELIDNLLALSQVTQSDMQTTRIDLSTMADEIVQELQKAEPTRRVETSIAPTMQVQGDLGLLRIALENLFSNAWKFTRHLASARIEFCREVQDSETIYLVRDNGAGFDMAYANKLFSAFQRLHDEQEFEGTGIGLATVRRIVRRHNGRVWAEAKPGQGATFYFTLG